MRLISLIFILYFTHIFSLQTLVYEKNSPKGNHNITYTVNKKSGSYHIEITSKDQESAIHASDPYKIETMDVKKKNGDAYKFELQGNTIIATGVINGEKLSASHKIDKKNPWIQEFDFGLAPLLSSSKSTLNFQLINPKNFKTHKLVAKKIRTEMLKIKDQTYEALLVEITLQGFKSMFWKAQIWYDSKTYDLLLYKSDEGPNTGSTTVKLVSKTVKVI